MVNNQQLLQRITSNPQIMVGKPIIKGTRLTVEFIGSLGSHGVWSEIKCVMRGFLWSHIAFCASFDVNPLNS